MTPKILHICADFPNQKLYEQLVRNVESHGWKQIVFSAVRSDREAGWTTTATQHVRYEIENILGREDRILFRKKIAKIARWIERRVDLASPAVLHAHTLYSDGAVALRLHRKYGHPFITAVRNVDVNVFAKYRPDLCFVRNAVVRKTAKLIFLSPAYRDAFLATLPKRLQTIAQKKSLVVPNGIAPFWLNETCWDPVTPVRSVLQILYVGDSTSNKNIQGLIDAFAVLERPAKLSIVGVSEQEAADCNLTLDNPDVTYFGKITDMVALRDVYASHDVFAMPSFTETFGIAYIEALSQGLPILLSRGQGVSGYFRAGGVAQEVDPHSTQSIADGLIRLIDQLPGIRAECVQQAVAFDWVKLAQIYNDIYLAPTSYYQSVFDAVTQAEILRQKEF